MASSHSSKSTSRHELDDLSLSNYLSKTNTIPGIQLPVRTTKIGYGQSNPSYFVDDAAGTRFVLRKKPAGTIISPVAHQVDREYRVLKALSSVEGFPVPKAYVLCMDSEVIGTPFYIMEFIKGRILTDNNNLEDLSPADRRKAWFSLVETQAWLHSLDPDSIGLEGYGKKKDFYGRQCNTFARIEAQQAKVVHHETGEPVGRAHDKYDEIMDFVRSNLPNGDRCSIIHGDFKFDNVVLHPTEPRIIGILDWELSTLGHPMLDVLFTSSPYWSSIARNQGGDEGIDSPYLDSKRKEAGMPELDELMDRYSRIAGWDPRTDNGGRDMEVSKIFHLIRGATIGHGIKARTYAGQASSEFSHKYFAGIQHGLDLAWSMVEEQRRKAGRKDQAKL